MWVFSAAERQKVTGEVRNDSIITGLSQQRESLLRRLAMLDDRSWDLVCPAPAAPPDVVRLDEPQRTVRQVVAHLLVIDQMVLRGGALRTFGGRHGLDHPGGWDLRRVQPLAAAPPAELVSLLAQRGARFARRIDAAPAPLRRIPVPGAFGRQSVAGLVTRRILHEWLHEQDIAAATAPGAAPSAGAAVAEAIADAVLQLLPTEVLPRTGLETGVIRLVLDLGPDAAPSRRTIWGLDFARRQYGPRVLARPEATIRLRATTLALLAHGRSDRLDDRPCADVEGDPALADVLLQALTAARAAAPCLVAGTLTRTAAPGG